MTEEELNNEKNRLIEQLGVVMEKKHQLAPIAARIMSTLVLNGQQGVTFEELVQNLCAGKSTISTHLDHLTGQQKDSVFHQTRRPEKILCDQSRSHDRSDQ